MKWELVNQAVDATTPFFTVLFANSGLLLALKFYAPNFNSHFSQINLIMTQNLQFPEH